MSFLAFIPARSGSTGVKNKNLVKINNKELIYWTINVARQCKLIKKVIVSTDSEKIAKIAIKYGAEVPFLRPPKYSGDKSIDREFLMHAIGWFKENEKEIPEMWIHLRPTTPLRQPEVIDDAIDFFQKYPEATSLRSAHIAPESPLKWFFKEGSYFKSFVDFELSNYPKEIFRETYIPNGYVDILNSCEVINNKNMHGENILGFVSPTVTEIDSLEEFEYISHQIKNKGSLLLYYLNSNQK